MSAATAQGPWIPPGPAVPRTTRRRGRAETPPAAASGKTPQERERPREDRAADHRADRLPPGRANRQASFRALQRPTLIRSECSRSDLAFANQREKRSAPSSRLRWRSVTTSCVQLIPSRHGALCPSLRELVDRALDVARGEVEQRPPLDRGVVDPHAADSRRGPSARAAAHELGDEVRLQRPRRVGIADRTRSSAHR